MDDFEKQLKQNPRARLEYALLTFNEKRLTEFRLKKRVVNLLKPGAIKLLKGLFNSKDDEGWKKGRQILKDSSSKEQLSNLDYNYLAPYIELGLVEKRKVKQAGKKKGKKKELNEYRLAPGEDNFHLIKHLLGRFCGKDYNAFKDLRGASFSPANLRLLSAYLSSYYASKYGNKSIKSSVEINKFILEFKRDMLKDKLNQVEQELKMIGGEKQA